MTLARHDERVQAGVAHTHLLQGPVTQHIGERTANRESGQIGQRLELWPERCRGSVEKAHRLGNILVVAVCRLTVDIVEPVPCHECPIAGADSRKGALVHALDQRCGLTP